jgi:hypothetical protein
VVKNRPKKCHVLFEWLLIALHFPISRQPRGQFYQTFFAKRKFAGAQLCQKIC